MKKTIKDVRNRLKEIKRTAKKNTLLLVANVEAPKGCCRITMGGSTANRSGITERQCREAANEFPGATYDFTVGVNCSDV